MSVKGLPQDTEIKFCWLCWQWHEPRHLVQLKAVWRRIDRGISLVGQVGEQVFNLYFKVVVFAAITIALLDVLYQWLFYY